MMNERAAIATNVVNERWGTFIGDSFTEVARLDGNSQNGDSLIAPDYAECQENFD
jgi:hypothetical protein